MNTQEQTPTQYSEEEIKEKCKYSLDISTLENHQQYYLGYRAAFVHLGLLKGQPKFIPWPEDVPKQRNASTEHCDMWTGPCCCGAWHIEGK